jgi:azurin
MEVPMKSSLRVLLFVALLSLSLLLAACGNNNAGSGGTTGGTSGGASGGTGSGTTIDIASAGENLAFDKTTLTATAGEQVTVRFKNNSAVQQHNWVLVNGDATVAQAVADAGLTAGLQADYLPADKANVTANTDVLDGGQTGETSFTAPAAGTYVYLCSVPGHYPLMQGTLTVN